MAVSTDENLLEESGLPDIRREFEFLGDIEAQESPVYEVREPRQLPGIPYTESGGHGMFYRAGNSHAYLRSSDPVDLEEMV